jgi:quinoprotein glucose dehydrogenase
VWPIEERAVEKGDVPGEWYSPTQPFVTKPPAYERQGVTVNDLIDYTPELRAEAEKLVSQYKIGPIFTPPVVSKWEGPRGTLMLPDVTGGANWQGGSYDPETKRFYIFTNVTITTLGLLPPTEGQSDMLFGRGAARNPNPAPAPAPGGGGGGGLTIRGLPLVKPPYATISAIDMNKGDLLWKIPHGDTADAIKNNPALKGLTIPRTGRQGRIGVLTTKTLLIAGEGGFNTTPDGRGAYLRAYDKATGADVGQVFMPAPQTGSPMTYMVNGTQYIAVAVSGPGFAGELLVYKLGN